MENRSLGEKEVKEMAEHQQHKKLISSELGDLFANYLGDSLFKCVFEHHLQVVEDNDIKEFLEFGLETGQKHLQMIRDIYEKENIPLPVGFGEEDVRKDAPRLFSDIFMVFYMTEMARAGLHTYASALSTSYRQDIINYFTMCLDDSTIIYNKGVHLLLSKGMDTAPPIIPYPKKVDFVEKDSFISVLAGKSRPVTALEIKHLQININTNTLGKAIMLAFSQIASSEELKAYFKRGANLANEQIVELGKLLLNDNLPTPKILDVHITDTTASPFSDKLLLYHAVLSTGIGIQNYGTAISKIMRHDIHLQFTTLSTSIGKFGNDGMELMIKKGWLEEPPTAADRDKLSRNS